MLLDIHICFEKKDILFYHAGKQTNLSRTISIFWMNIEILSSGKHDIDVLFIILGLTPLFCQLPLSSNIKASVT